ncbi:MAG: Gfo/Idh/MocA family oxidoreductase [Oscillospiraceae bacterium]|nr:Gfo/Idh/MocA family oxidoreductase [Oscillospiraceae bacterium]
MKIGVLGAGGIARLVSATLKRMPEVECYAVASRSLDKAQEFAYDLGFTKAYGSYEEMLSDENVELVYITTIHSLHYEHAMLAISHGKPVICEKPFCVNAKELKSLFEYAKKQNVFITEAIWTRYMPMRNTIDEVIASGIIGKPVTLTANLGYSAGGVERLAKNELAGGALLDIGVYPINFALMHFGNDYTSVTSDVVFTENNVDMQSCIILKYADGRMAVITSTFCASADRKGIIWGTNGYIVTENVNNCQGIKVYDKEHNELASYSTPEQISGYEYEFLSAIKAISLNQLECPEMPHEESLRVMVLMDRVRSDWGLEYPNDR